MNLSDHDSKEIYCRKLGHHLHFAYCRQERFDQPCSRVKECWQYKIPLTNLWPDSASPEIRDGRSAKLLNIMEIIEQISLAGKQQ